MFFQMFELYWHMNKMRIMSENLEIRLSENDFGKESWQVCLTWFCNVMLDK